MGKRLSKGWRLKLYWDDDSHTFVNCPVIFFWAVILIAEYIMLRNESIDLISVYRGAKLRYDVYRK